MIVKNKKGGTATSTKKTQSLSKQKKGLWSRTKKYVRGSPSKPVTTTFVGSSKILLKPFNIIPELTLERIRENLNAKLKHDLNIPTYTSGLMSLADGSMFSISFFGVVRDSYARILNKWSPGDEIEYVYTGGVKAHLLTGNFWEIKNVTRGGETIKGDKLAKMY